MKRLVTVFFGLMLIASFANAADFSIVGGDSEQIFGELNGDRYPLSITQNVDPGYMDALISVACGVSGSHTTQNWYLRRFALADYGIANDFTVQSVDFGVDQCTTDGFGVDMVLFSIATGDPFVFANMTEIARVTVPVGTADTGMFLNAAIGGAVTVGSDLVVAIDAPDGEPTFTQFRPGVNAGGATHDSYLAAEGCGIVDPMGVSAIGFPDSQLILVVNGVADEGTTATEDATFSSVKSLY